MTTKDNTKCKNIHLQSGVGVDMIIKTALVRRSLDNVTCVMIAFSNFEKLFKNEEHIFNIPKPITQIDSVIKTTDEKDRYTTLLNNSLEKRLNDISNNSTNTNFNSASNQQNNSNTNSQQSLKNNYHSEETQNYKKAPLHTKYDSYTGINLESYKNGVLDSQTRKNYIQKKLVSLDMSSSNKKVFSQHNNTKNDKEISSKKKLDYSEHYEKDKSSIPYLGNDFTILNHPSTTKNTILRKENQLINSIKKIPSYKRSNYDKF